MIIKLMIKTNLTTILGKKLTKRFILELKIL